MSKDKKRRTGWFTPPPIPSVMPRLRGEDEVTTAPQLAIQRVASIDVGSNSVLMLLAERTKTEQGWAWERLEDYAEVTRISEGLDASGVLAEHAVERTRAQLQTYVERAREQNVDQIVATGTAPFRRARNGAEVARALGDSLGISLDVVSGEREAELSQIATRAAFPALGAMTILDIGGASTEVIALDGEGNASMVSLDVGAVRLGERFACARALDTERESAMKTAIAEAIAPAAPLLLPGRALVGIAGTVTTLATAAMQLREWDAEKVHGYALSAAAVCRLRDTLGRMSTQARAAMPGVPAKRADVLPAGAALLAALMEAAEATEVIVSDRGVRWGRLAEFDAPE